MTPDQFPIYEPAKLGEPTEAFLLRGGELIALSRVRSADASQLSSGPLPNLPKPAHIHPDVARQIAEIQKTVDAARFCDAARARRVGAPDQDNSSPIVERPQISTEELSS